MNSPAIIPAKQRINGIDALRGLAVLLMLTQHIIYWVCAELNTSMTAQVFGALGGLAAPVFIVLSGSGAVLSAQRHENIDKLLAGRGLMILGFGYLLNMLAPNWFSMGSWYVLHMIGFGLLTAPVLRRLPDAALVIFVLAVVAVTAAIQHVLDTSFFLNNHHMTRMDLPGGVLRLVFAESFFPVFPWIAFFTAGLLAGRWLVRSSPMRTWQAASILFTAAIVVSGIYLAGFEFAARDPWVRIFKPIPNFYPALTPVTLFLISAALFLIAFFTRLQKHFAFVSSNVLVCLGRCSLTILIIHVATIREAAVRLGFWRSLSLDETLWATLAVLAFFSAAAFFWRKIHFKYGAEWLLRKVFP